MAQPAWDNGDHVPGTPRRGSSDPTMLKALLRERHWQNYTLFTRAYQNAAKALDKDLVNTYPSLSTFRRWLAGQVHDLPHAEHCTVLEAMLPGWTATELFQPPQPPDDTTGSTLLQELLQRHHLHHYPQFCRAYDITAVTIDQSLVGTHPTEPQFHQWIRGQTPELPHPGHRTVLEAMFPGHSTRQLFAITEPPVVEIAEPPEPASPDQPASPDEPDPATRDGHPESSGAAGLILPDEMPAWAMVTGLPLPAPVIAALLRCLDSLTSSLTRPAERDRAYHQLEQLLRRWAHTMDRRNALQLLGWAASAAAAAATLASDGYERIASVLSGQSRVDPQTIEHIEAVLRHCQRQDHALGPHAALDTVLAQRQLARSLLPHCPDPLRPRLLSALSESSRQAGWLSFDLNQFDEAGYYYEDARASAHEAQNAQRGALVLCEMSHLATWRGMPRTGIDHAVAAEHWSRRTGDAKLRSYTFNVAARAYAADGQRDACLTALDAAHAALPAAGDHSAESVILFGDEAHLTSIRGGCHLELHDGRLAADYARQSLRNLDPSAVRNTAFTTVDLSMAYVQCEEIDEAARLLGDAGEIAAGNSSARLAERLRQSRAQLQPWHDTNAVRELDERLVTYGIG